MYFRAANISKTTRDGSEVKTMAPSRLAQLLLIGSSLAVAAVTFAQPPSPGVLERGKAVYDASCATCHGADGRAETPAGRLLTPRPRNFADPVEMARVTVDRIYHAIKEGRPGTAMPAWGSFLTETQIGDVIDYLRSLTKPLPPTLSLEALSLEIGRRIYHKECAFCHGADGGADTEAAKVLRPRPRHLADPVEMARVDDGRMYSAIKLGRPGTGMAGWGELLSPAEIIDVMRYVRTLVKPLPAGMTSAQIDLAAGRKIYEAHCVSCHGEKGNGQTPLGQYLKPPPRDFTRVAEMARISDKEMAQVIAQGSPGTAMAPWSGILNADDTRRVILFIRQSFQLAPQRP